MSQGPCAAAWEGTPKATRAGKASATTAEETVIPRRSRRNTGSADTMNSLVHRWLMLALTVQVASDFHSKFGLESPLSANTGGASRRQSGPVANLEVLCPFWTSLNSAGVP